MAKAIISEAAIKSAFARFQKAKRHYKLDDYCVTGPIIRIFENIITYKAELDATTVERMLQEVSRPVTVEGIKNIFAIEDLKQKVVANVDALEMPDKTYRSL